MRVSLLIVLPLLGACSLGAPTRAIEERCTSDMGCGGKLVCFPDGCGDPGQMIVVEVTGNRTQLLPQDVDLGLTGGLKAVTDLAVRGPLTMNGVLERDTANGNTSPYTDGITVSVAGESTLIPGVLRSYSYSVQKASGTYQMYVGAGRYNVTARPSDAAIPYQTKRDIFVAPGGDQAAASFTFKTVEQTLFLTGKLVKQTLHGTMPVTIYNPAGMAIQAFDAVGGTALSQSAEVSSEGVFTLAIDYSVVPDYSTSLPTTIWLVASPRENTVLVPTKTFALNPAPLISGPVGTLEMGDYGDALPQVKGTLRGSDGRPVGEASVTLEGKVGGGGTFKSRTVTTDAMGVFTVDLLPTSSGEGLYTLTAHPPPESAAGILDAQVRAEVIDGTPVLIGPSKSSDFSCPDRVIVNGTVTRASGERAANVEVTATAIEALDGRRLPVKAASTLTDQNGAYSLWLDKAKYRLDYLPGEQLPRKARVVRVAPDVDADAGTLLPTFDLGNFELSVPRTVKGQVTVLPNSVGGADGGAGAPASNAVVRFFRVTSVEGKSSSLLIGEAIADTTGNYQIVLPDHPEGTAYVEPSDAGDGGP